RGGDEDHGAAALLAHVGEAGARDPERRGQVRLDERAEDVLRRRLDRAFEAPGRAGHEHVDPPVGLVGLHDDEAGVSQPRRDTDRRTGHERTPHRRAPPLARSEARMPPSTRRTEPLQNEPSAEAKNATAAATSAPVPTRDSGGSVQVAGSPLSSRPATN